MGGSGSSYYEKVGSETNCIDEEVPYELPDGWCWSRLASCCVKEIKRGKSPQYAESGQCLAFAQKCNTKYNGIDISLALFIDNATIQKYPEAEFMSNEDIVINSTGTGTLGRVGIYHTTDNHTGLPIVPDSHVTVIRPSGFLLAEYIFCFLKAMQPELEKLGEGSTNQKELKPATLMELLVPVPPLVEQGKIIGKAKLMLAELNTIAENLS